MAKEFAKAFYEGMVWRKFRKVYINQRRMIDGGMCEICHERPGYIVHHKILLTPDNIGDDSISLNPDLVEYVCKPCHDREDGHFIGCETSAKRRFGFDSDGCPFPTPPSKFSQGL